MTTTKLFTTNTTQAVRLSKAVAFPPDVTEVEVIVLGDARLISPVAHRWDYFFDAQLEVSEDFLAARDQPLPQERETL